jgi:hypothetical protein
MADVNAGLLQAVQAATGHLWIRVLHCRYHASHACGDQRVAARRRATMVATGLQGDVGGRAFGFIAGHTQRVHFGVRLAGPIVEALADDLAVFYNHTADVGIRMGSKASARGKLQRSRHVHFVLHGLVL